jgi:hypothetical protein
MFKQFVKVETCILKELGNQLIHCDSLYVSYARLSHFGLGAEPPQFHLGLYVLYLALFSGKICSRFKRQEIVCASINLSLRLQGSPFTWSTHLTRESGGMYKDDFIECTRELAIIYVNMINRGP